MNEYVGVIFRVAFSPSSFALHFLPVIARVTFAQVLGGNFGIEIVRVRHGVDLEITSTPYSLFVGFYFSFCLEMKVKVETESVVSITPVIGGVDMPTFATAYAAFTNRIGKNPSRTDGEKIREKDSIFFHREQWVASGKRRAKRVMDQLCKLEP
jgi:hypothetical protein